VEGGVLIGVERIVLIVLLQTLALALRLVG
jgi:hypothetical protein